MYRKDNKLNITKFLIYMTVDPSIKEEIANAKKKLTGCQAFVGFDGFVDKIVSPIDKVDFEKQTHELIPTITQFGDRIHSAAGKSANIELFEKLEKLGGNGPIMANAQMALGLEVKYMGALGKPDIHPVFKKFSQSTKAISLTNPGITHAVEFEDGKIMFGTMKSLQAVNYKEIVQSVGEDDLVKMFDQADSISMVNWTMLLNLTEVFRKLIETILPKLTSKKYFFFDLADPEKRTDKEILELVELLKAFEPYGQVILGLNLRESSQIDAILNLGKSEDDLSLRADAIRKKLSISCVVIHPVSSAHCSSEKGCFNLEGPYCEKPKITTGGGDHFNAGFVTAKLLGLSDMAALVVAVSTSGYYVRTAESPNFDNIISFINSF